jgi:hypothetical protein
VKKWPFMFTLALGLAGTASAREETWGDWMSPPENAPLVAEFQPGWKWETWWQQSEYHSKAEDCIEANHGYEGDLVFGVRPGADTPPGPLQVHLSYTVAAPAEMNWPQWDKFPDGFVLAVLPQAVPRAAAMEETRTVPAEFPLRVPVILPWNCRAPMSYGKRRPAALFGRYKVVDANGRELSRGLLSAHKLSGSIGSLTGIANAEEALEQGKNSIGSLVRTDDLPAEMAAYRQVRGIWFTESLWQKMAGREALLRRLLLSGIRFSGATALVERIRSTLDAGPDGLVPGSAVAPGTWDLRNDLSLRPLNQWSGQADRKTGRERCIFENDVDLFGADRNAYLIWTLAGVLAFSLGVAVLLGVVFIRFKGERRVAVWWALPGWAALCFAAIWAGGWLVLERRPWADVTEYRLGMANWPEMHCRAVASAMTFDPGRPEWKLPPGAVVQADRYESLDGGWKQIDARISAEGIRLRLPRKMTGSVLELEAGWYEPTSAPVALEAGMVVATEDVDGAFAMIETEWHALGPMKAGERRDPRLAPTPQYNHLAGMPKVLDDAFPYEHTDRRTCRNPSHQHPPEWVRLTRQHDWILVAWKRDVPPRVAPIWDDSLTKGRTIWVIQCP